MDLHALFCFIVGVSFPSFGRLQKCSFNAFWCKKFKFDQNGLTWFM